MSGDRRDGLNEHGLFVHPAAREAIEAFIREGLVGQYPIYLVGLALPEHRCGPAVIALLTLPDGGLLHANARTLGRKQRVNGVLEYDADFMDGEGLQRYRRVFYQEFGGFSSPCLEVSPTAAAEAMLRSCGLGLHLGPKVGPNPEGPPARFPSDWTDVVYYSQGAIGCTVEGFSPSADAIGLLDVSGELKRAMQVAESPGLRWLDELKGRLEHQVHVRIPAMVAEAWAIRSLSPQASVVLLRSVAELVVESLGVPDGTSLFKELDRLEARWEKEPPDKSPAGRREHARRVAVLSCLHTIRDLGNQIHADSVVAAGEVTLAHDSNRRLLEAVLGAGPLD